MRTTLLTLVLLLFLPSVATSHSWTQGRPALPSLSAKEEAKLVDDKLLLWTHRDENDEGSGIVTGLIEIEATPQEIWKILLDFESIPETSGAMKTAVRYEDKPNGSSRIIGVEYMVKVGWVEIEYSIHHDYFAADNYLVWSLDPARENGIDATDGSFSTWPGSAPGRTRFLYRTSIDTGRNVPKWIEEDLSEGSLKSYIKAVKKRAEE